MRAIPRRSRTWSRRARKPAAACGGRSRPSWARGLGRWATPTRGGDPYLLILWVWGRIPPLAFDMARDFPNWTAHARRMAERPAVRRAFERKGLELPG